MKKLILWMVALSIVLAACGKSDKQIASVNGRGVTQSEFDAFLKFKRIPAQDGKNHQAILDQYLEREALAGVIEQDSNMDKALIAAELNEFRKEMLISRYFEQYLNNQVTDAAVKNYYSAHAKDYEERKVHVAHILLRTDRSMNEAARKAKLTTAQEAYSKIKSGVDFGEIAKQYSEDTLSGRKNGDIGWLKEGAIDPRFSKTVFEMKAGAVSEPFETAFGYHIVKLLEGPVVVKRPYEAVSGDIRYQLRNEAKDAELKRLLAKTSIKK